MVIQHLLKMIDQEDLAAIQQYALAEMVRLTGSAAGFHATLSSDEMNASVDHVLPPLPTALAQPHTKAVVLVPTSMWYECVARREAVVRNRPASEPLPGADPAQGLSNCDLTVPVCEGGRVVAVIGVANRETGYGLPEAELLHELALGLGRVLVRKRLHDSLQEPPA